MEAPILISLSSSGFASVATLWFWMIRMNRERPAVNAYLEGTGRHDPWAEEDRVFEGTPEIAKTTYRNVFHLPMIVVNESIKPNAVVNVAGAVMLADGSMAECDASWHAGTLPLSLPPDGTSALDVTLKTRRIFERDADESWRDAVWSRDVPRPLRFRVEFQLLGGRKLTTLVTHTPLEQRLEAARVRAEDEKPKAGDHHPPSGLRVKELEDNGARAAVRVHRGAGYSGQTIAVDDTINDAVGTTYRYKGAPSGRPVFLREADGSEFTLRVEPADAE